MITLKKMLPVNVWNEKKRLTLVELDAEKRNFNGYNRESAAFNEAIDNCGIKGFPCFSGSGCNEWALGILCKILNVKKYKIVEFYA